MGRARLALKEAAAAAKAALLEPIDEVSVLITRRPRRAP